MRCSRAARACRSTGASRGASGWTRSRCAAPARRTDRVVAVGKRLSDRLYISYEQGLGTTASQLVKLDFSLTQRLALRTETGTSTGVGFFYRFSWD